MIFFIFREDNATDGYGNADCCDSVGGSRTQLDYITLVERQTQTTYLKDKGRILGSRCTTLTQYFEEISVFCVLLCIKAKLR